MNTALAVVEPQDFTDRQLNLIKTTIAPGVDDDQLGLFVEVARRTGLDPFSRQIYAILRNQNEKKADGTWHSVKRMTIQTGIDGYRAIAARTGLLAGIDEPVYDTEDTEHPNKAAVTVWRFVHGQRCAFTASARWSEYKPEKSPMWDRMPYLMLGKCAEALALRKAFPNEISGVYTAEEMSQADNEPARYVEHAGRTVDAGTGEIVRPVEPVREESPDATIKRRIAEAREMTERTVPLGKPQAQPAKPAQDDPWQEVRELAEHLAISDAERAEMFKRHKRNRDKILAELRDRYARETSDPEPDVTFEVAEPEPADDNGDPDQLQHEPALQGAMIP